MDNSQQAQAPAATAPVADKIGRATRLLQARNVGEALPLVIEVLNTAPLNTDAAQLLSVAAEINGQYDMALNVLSQIEAAHPDAPHIQAYKGFLHFKKEDFSAARPLLEAGLTRYPAAFCFYALGVICMFAGEADEAEANLRKACDLDPATPNYLYTLFNYYHRVERPDDPLFQRLQKYDPAGYDDYSASLIHSALFKGWQDLKAYDKAFAHVRQAMDLRRKHLKYDPKKTRQYFEDIESYFCRAFFAKNREATRPAESNGTVESDSAGRAQSADGSADAKYAAGKDTAQPVFVLGMPRSGTTLMEQILHAHPAVAGIGEDTYLSTLIRDYSHMLRFEGHPYPLRENTRKEDYLSVPEIAAKYLDYMKSKAPGAQIVINKAMGNRFYAGFIKLALPQAKFIHITRNPQDCCLSCYATNFRDDAQPYSYDLKELGEHYRWHTRLMAHWQELFPDDILKLRYEDLVADVEGQARRMIDFLRLPWDESCLTFHHNASAVQTASATQIRRPVYTSSVERWKRYERHLGPLLAELEQIQGPRPKT